MKKHGLALNNYDPCGVNRIVNSHKMKVTWHVVDLKISYKDPFYITMFVHYSYKIYEKNLIVHEGNIYEYMGMETVSP